MSSIPEKIRDVSHQISEFAQKYKRASNSVLLLAVSKTQAADKIIAAHQAGQNDFGENYLQEALEKISQLKHLSLSWHFIGPIQSNKTKAIAESFAWVHSVDRVKIARRLNEQRPDSLPPLNVFLQVNIDQEPSKAGLTIEELPVLAEHFKTLKHLKLCGLMAIPAPAETFEQQRLAFHKLAQARDDLLTRGFVDCQHLSMGMSRDFEAAIAEGSTIVRIGTDIFGARTSISN